MTGRVNIFVSAFRAARTWVVRSMTVEESVDIDWDDRVRRVEARGRGVGAIIMVMWW